jgi:hypothetical protein
VISKNSLQRGIKVPKMTSIQITSTRGILSSMQPACQEGPTQYTSKTRFDSATMAGTKFTRYDGRENVAYKGDFEI